MAIVVGTKKEKAPREAVQFGFMRDDEFETIELQAVLGLDAGGMHAALAAARSESPDLLIALFRTVAKMLDNTDGVPAGWRPTPMYRARGGGSTDNVEFAEDPEAEPSFRVPFGEEKGTFKPLSQAAPYLEPQAGSSRARWNHLINEDDGAVVDAGDVTKLFEQMVGAAAKRPTVASS